MSLIQDTLPFLLFCICPLCVAIAGKKGYVCRSTPKPDNGKVTRVDSFTLTFKCDKNFTLSGWEEITCNNNRTWPPAPKCIG